MRKQDLHFKLVTFTVCRSRCCQRYRARLQWGVHAPVAAAAAADALPTEPCTTLSKRIGWKFTCVSLCVCVCVCCQVSVYHAELFLRSDIADTLFLQESLGELESTML